MSKESDNIESQSNSLINENLRENTESKKEIKIKPIANAISITIKIDKCYILSQ